MISREKAQQLLDKYITTPWLKLHMRESEVILRGLARELGEDEEQWGIAGLLHDLDFDFVNKDPKRHVIEFDNILEKEGIKIGKDITQDMYHAIKSHYEEHPDITQKRESNFDYALSAAENLSGFLVACALVQPDKRISSVHVDSVLKKFKKKDFAKGVNRQYMYDIEKTGIPLDRFIEIALIEMNSIADEIGL
ncbi:MAG: HD domain-containing protein [Candidatus Dojkabacteria bacterium]|jgi:predicted hydrolase (HD superfamily)|nr:HD domain-containing protein [Candidatus Dojkabacteria bacterium]